MDQVRRTPRLRLTNRGRVALLLLITLVLLGIARLVDAPESGARAEMLPRDDQRVAGPFSVGAKPCTDVLANTLQRAGFTGRDLREAWAIAMRESGGQPDLISHRVDHGLFQFNIDAHRDKDWWDTKRLLNADYNARVAFLTSQGGADWSMWGLTGDGKTDARMYPMWDKEQVRAWITEPFERYFAESSRLPRSCRG